MPRCPLSQNVCCDLNLVLIFNSILLYFIQQLEDLLEELDEVTGGPPRIRRPAPSLNDKDALNGALSRPSSRGNGDDIEGSEFKDYPQYQQPFQGRKFGVGGGEDDFLMGATAGAAAAVGTIDSDRLRPGSTSSLMRGHSSSGGGGVGGDLSREQLASSGGGGSRKAKAPPSGENATTALLRDDGEAVGQDGPVFVDRIRVERAEVRDNDRLVKQRGRSV